MLGTRRRVPFTLLAVIFAGCSTEPPGDREMPLARYDPDSGRLARIEFDSTRNGRNDAVGIMEGTRVDRIEVDEDEDGAVDRWEFYGEGRRLLRTGFSRNRSGLMDGIAFYGGDGIVERIEISTRADGKFNRIEYFEAESLARVEEDTNGDGRTDKWETYAADAHAKAPVIVTAAFDDSFRGTPSRRLMYRADGTVLRVDVDPDGDGLFVAATSGRWRADVAGRRGPE